MTGVDDDRRQPSRAGITDTSRREFLVLSVAAGLAASGHTIAAPTLPVVVDEVVVKTADGQCDAAFIHPVTGRYAGVIIWPDAFGLRPTMRDIGARLAAEGYSVIVPNPFYRIGKAPMYESAASVDFQNPVDRAKLQPLVASINAAGAAETDVVGFVGFLDSQSQVDRAKKIGTHGYCMGGALAVRSAARAPDRIGAAASFHGGGLVTDKPDSPHRLAPKIDARMYFGIAANDDARQPDAKDKLNEAFAAARVPAEIEVYPAKHGWCVPDMPADAGVPIYSKPDAERAWTKLIALYGSALA